MVHNMLLGSILCRQGTHYALQGSIFCRENIVALQGCLVFVWKKNFPKIFLGSMTLVLGMYHWECRLGPAKSVKMILFLS